jgi:hypothetical protein
MEPINSGYPTGFPPLSWVLKATSGMVNGECGATPAPTSLRGGAADAAIQFHPLTISHHIDIVSTRKAKPLDCRVGFASSQ